jgi:hypothetical protein
MDLNYLIANIKEFSFRFQQLSQIDFRFEDNHL